MLYPEQHAAFFHAERTGLVEASTKSGKTTAAMLWILAELYGRPAYSVAWWIAPTYQQARIAFKRLRPLALRADMAALRLTFGGAREIEFKSAVHSDHLYGEDVVAAVVDEASRVGTESITAVRSTLTATRGRWRLCGNVRGVSNRFYAMCRASARGELPHSHYAKIDAHTAARYSLRGLPGEDEIAAAKRELTPAAFQELYEVRPAIGGACPFELDDIMACTARTLSTAPVAAWGVDLAKTQDYTVIVGIDADGRVAHFARFQMPWDRTMSMVASTLGTECRASIDATGVGSPVVDVLRNRYNCPVTPFVFTAKSKADLVDLLRLDIAARRVRYPEAVAEELVAFEATPRATGVNYAAESGAHDDAVMALALAVWQLRSTARYAEFLSGGTP